MPCLKDRFIISIKGSENYFLNDFKILVVILFGPLALFSSKLLGLQCPLELEKGKSCYCCLGRDKISIFMTWQYLFTFSTTLIKKLLKWLEISLVLVIIWSSSRRLEIDLSDFFFKFIVPLMVCHTMLRFFCCLQSTACSKNLLSL